ncbi:MAG: efflux RND transporter permease subunit [Pseudomonadota bacterium]
MKTLLTNHPLVNVLFLVVLAMGALSYAQMPREQDPEISFNWVVIQIPLPGASAVDVEQLVTSPIEDALRQVQDIRTVSSSSRQGLSNILVRFHELSEREFDKRLSDLRREVQNKANDELPEDAEDPDIREITSSNGFPTVLVVVAGQARDEALRREARLVRDDIERIVGVDKVDTLGLAEPELIVELDPSKLARNRLSATEVADTLRGSFQNIFAGSTRVDRQEWLVRVQNTTEDPAELAQFPLASRFNPNQKLRLGDVARVYRGTEDPFQLVSIDGRPAISLAVSKVAYTNTLELVDKITAYIESRNELISNRGFEIILADDQTVPTRAALSVMQTNALLGLTLVLLVSWLFLGFRIAGLVTLGLIFSITGTFWILNVTGNTLNVSVLLGIVIVLGMLVDDAVVVVEAIYYRLQRGHEALQASLGALAEVARPVTSAVSTTVSAFLPLMLMPGIVGDFMFVVPFVVAVGLAVSLVEAFWILPAHVISVSGPSKQLVKPEGEHWRTRFTRLVRIRYTQSLVKVLRNPMPFIALAASAFVIAVGLAFSGVIKTNFFAADPLRIFYVSLTMQPDASLEETLEATEAVERRVQSILQDGEALAVTALAGVRFTETEMLVGDQYGQIQVSLNPHTNGSRPVGELVAAMREPVGSTPVNAEISFLELSGGPPIEPLINLKLLGDNLDELRSAADLMLSKVASIEGARDVIDDETPGRQELVIDLNENAVRDAGLDPASVSRLIRLHMDGEVVAFVRSQGEKLELRVRGPERKLNNIEAILDDPIVLSSGAQRTLRTMVQTSTVRGSGVIKHFSYKRTITVSADLDTSKIDAVEANAMALEMWADIRPQFPGVEINTAGALEDIQESLDAMLGLFLMGIGFIYLILATQFRSYFQPLLILLTVPMAFTGVLYGLLLTGHPLSIWTLYGVVALTGIAVNAAIVLIDAANSRMRAGMRPLHATIYAARRRVVPILMTTLTTIAGLLSLAIGLGGKSLVWGPVAASIVAGLLVASTLTLFLLPVLYRLFMRKKSPADMASRA